MKLSKWTAVGLSAAMLATMLAGCGGSGSSTATSGSTGEAASQASGTAASGEKQTLSFWYHSADPVTDAYFEDYFEQLNASQDQYEVEYTSFSFADF